MRPGKAGTLNSVLTTTRATTTPKRRFELGQDEHYAQEDHQRQGKLQGKLHGNNSRGAYVEKRVELET